jgi:hypothetical protein
VAALARRHRILGGGLWRIYREFAVWHAPFLVLRRVANRGTVLEVIACPDDAQHFTEVVFWRPWLRWLKRRPTFKFERDELMDHSLLSRHAQVEAFERATQFLEAHGEAAPVTHKAAS